jgi:tetratricopeptide (TPR) repeat protein
MKGFDDVVTAHQDSLKGVMRVDIFGLRDGGEISGALHAPLLPELPTLEPGQNYLLETVIRTMTMGHHFTQGTADSNEVWLDVTLKSGGRVIGRSGGMDERRSVDPWSHFVNVFMLDEDGNRINRRNPQDIRVPLYNHQIPPGAGQVVHYQFGLPEQLDDHVTIEVKLQYRKFDQDYLEFVVKKARPGDLDFRGKGSPTPVRNDLPITTLATDVLTLPVKGVAAPLPEQKPREFPVWQRWNDYGIGLLLKGRGELRQASDAFAQVETLGRWDGAVNQARVALVEGRIDDAVTALNRARDFTDPPPPNWTMAWFSARANRQQGRLDEAEKDLRTLVQMKVPERGFDFSLDYNAINELDKAKQVRGASRKAERTELLKEAVTFFERTLTLDSENVNAHYNLQQLYANLKVLSSTESEQKRYEDLSATHHALHLRYKEDDNIRTAIAKGRQKSPAGNRAAEAVTIYPLQRTGAPELPGDAPSTPIAIETDGDPAGASD